MLDLEVERQALYEAIVSVDHSAYVTGHQVRALVGLFKQGLQDKSDPNRIKVMKYLIGQAIWDTFGVEFASFKNMSASIAALLIDRLLEQDTKWRINAYGYELIHQAEIATKESITI